MISPALLEDLPERVTDLYAACEERILVDMARRIAKTGEITSTARWQAYRLETLGLAQEDVVRELAKVTGKAETELARMFMEGCEKSLDGDDAIYREAGLNPVPLLESENLRRLLQAGLEQTWGLFENLTGTIANTATRQFENVLDGVWTDLVSGAFDYRAAITRGIKQMGGDGVEVQYPSGHKDKMDVAIRRAALTGVNQTAARMQVARMDEMGCDLVETTAHPGARPSHAAWQGKRFSRSGSSGKYPDFITATGYGTGPGLCGWNCRHSFFPVFEESKNAYTAAQLREWQQQKVEYNGKKMTDYEASQVQRYIERNIRKYKRTAAMLEEAGQDAATEKRLVRDWQARQRDFIKQTGRVRDYYRERAGNQYK